MKNYNTEQAAKFLNVSVRTLKYWRKNGKLIPSITDSRGAKLYTRVQLEGVQNVKSGVQKSEGCKKSSAELHPKIAPPTKGVDTMKQTLENLPEEFLRQARFFPVSENKLPKIEGWQKPENQKPYTEVDGPAGFDCSGHDVAPDYCLLDFDHVLDDDGNFVNNGAEKFFADVINALDASSYCEKSISGCGLHILVRPTAGKFGKLSAGATATLYFDDERGKNSPKLEMFYRTGGRYVLLTGNRFKCAAGATIPCGVDVDIILDYVLQRIQDNLPKNENPVPEKKISVPIVDNDGEKPTEQSRAVAMLNKIPCAEQTYSDWVATGMILKNNGNDLSDWEQWSATDFARFKPGECQKKWEGFSDNGGLTIATLHKFARTLYDYNEKEFQREWYSEHSPKKFQDNRAADERGDVEKKSAPDTDLQLTDEEIKKMFLLPHTDLYNGRRLAYVFGKNIRYLREQDKWAIYDKTAGTWTISETARNTTLYTYAAKLADCFKNNPPANVDEKVAAKFIKSWQNKTTISNAVEMIKSVENIIIKQSDLDKNPMLFNAANGVVDLETGKLMQHSPELLFTQKSPAAYKPGMRSKVFDDFMIDILPDEETRSGVLRFLGYCLSGSVREEKLLFVLGSGRNGKGSLFRTITKTVGDYGTTLGIKSLLIPKFEKDGDAPTPELAKLDKKRFAFANEIPDGGRLNVSLIKDLTGGDFFTVRKLHAAPQIVEPTHKFILCGNFLPELPNGSDIGLNERLIVARFTKTFTGENCDPHLKEKLSQPDNLSGVLTVLVDECLKWQREGLTVSAAMKREKTEYLQTQDFVKEFIDEFCERGAEFSVRRSDLINRIVAEYPDKTQGLTKQALRAAFEKAGVHYRRGKGGYKFFGIRFLPDFTEQQDFISPEDLPFEE